MNFLNRFSKNTQISYVIKFRSVRAKWVDRQMDGHDEANSYILLFCEHAYKSACMWWLWNGLYVFKQSNDEPREQPTVGQSTPDAHRK